MYVVRATAATIYDPFMRTYWWVVWWLRTPKIPLDNPLRLWMYLHMATNTKHLKSTLQLDREFKAAQESTCWQCGDSGIKSHMTLIDHKWTCRVCRGVVNTRGVEIPPRVYDVKTFSTKRGRPKKHDA